MRKLMLTLSQAGRRSRFVHALLCGVRNAFNAGMSLLPNSWYASLMVRVFAKEKLNLKQPRAYLDKLWWLKFHYRNPLMVTCSDKYHVRSYVQKCGLERILIPLIKVYQRAEDVDFREFKTEVFLKCTQGSGGNIIYSPADTAFDERLFRRDFRRLLKRDYSKYSREWNYKGLQQQIVAEGIIRDRQGRLPSDYKILCFQGEPRLLLYSQFVCDETGRHNTKGNRFVNIYDVHTRELLPVEMNIPRNLQATMEFPANFDEMLEVARTLSKPFPMCRVDLYNVDGKVYFGEITFFPSGGLDRISPREWALKMGDWIDLQSIPQEFIRQ